MSDGKFATDYRTSCERNQELQKLSGAKNPYEHRMFLQRNATKLMELERAKFMHQNQHNCTCPNCNLIEEKRNGMY